MDFRQYRLIASSGDDGPFVQAAQIISVPEYHGMAPESVRVADTHGLCSVIHARGLFRRGVPVVGDWVLLLDDGRTVWVEAELFEREWRPIRGPVLS